MGREPAEPARTGGKASDDDAGTYYRQAFEHSPEAIVVAQDGRLCAVNRAAESLTGHSRARLLEIAFVELVDPDDRAELLSRYERRLAGESTLPEVNFRVIDAAGGVHWLEAHSFPTTWNRRPALLSFFVEVTERERQRRATAELEHLLERIAALSPYFIFIYDFELGRDVYINRPVPRALGYSDAEAEALGPYPFDRLCHPDDYAQAIDRDARWRHVPDRGVDTVEFRLRNRAGEWRWFRSINTPFLRDADGRIRQFLGVSLDVSEQKRSEEALRRSEKLEGIGLLAGGLAHDFGNLLTPILGHAELMLRKLAEDSPLRARVETIRTAAERAGDLVTQLLVVSGRGAFEPRAVDLGDLIAEAAALLEPVLPAEVELRTEIAAGLPPVAGDPSQLRQVVLNLVGNARDALADRGGTIVVRALPVDVDEAQAAVLELRERVELGPAVLLEVEDDGPGMDEATRARLLEPFFTTKPQGRGLGLASVVGIVRRHRGGLEVDSNPGRGTIFRILLPLATRSAPASSVA
ncbi:MAG TPA: PAS domain S-box protein [Thermoanaerobaculia bacterium]|nr:PAS domain S-box protein [Thermoanaerobaculia bacterium]